MNIANNIIVSIIYIIFPILCYLFYVSYNEMFSKKTNNLFLEIALFTSTYLCIKVGNGTLMLFNIPLLISYLKNRKTCSLIISGIIIYHYILLEYNPIFITLSYLLIYIIFLVLYKNKLVKKHFTYLFITLNMFFYLLYNINNLYMTSINIFSFAIISIIILFVLKKAESIVSIHMSVKQLENSKEIRNSLFKITHEIKNPIAVCKGYLDMFDKNNPKHVEKFIPIIQSEINRTLTIMNDFMEFSKVKLDLDIMDIEMLLEEVLISLDNLINSKHINLNYEIIGDEIFINGDYNRLKQVFVNLLKNSVEALENINNGKIDVNYIVENNNIIINIKDNGIGMDSETLSKIYEAFYTTKNLGTGLGVSLSKEIIEGHHGNIEYISEVNNGTNVKVTLPLVDF
ncbi:MAG: HAMP domain-containing histidine kinase [Bacilli bacterium]|nr:HAMP domain-containing histidine kinase [Bacilli bacterium]